MGAVPFVKLGWLMAGETGPVSFFPKGVYLSKLCSGRWPHLQRSSHRTEDGDLSFKPQASNVFGFSVLPTA